MTARVRSSLTPGPGEHGSDEPHEVLMAAPELGCSTTVSAPASTQRRTSQPDATWGTDVTNGLFVLTGSMNSGALTLFVRSCERVGIANVRYSAWRK